MPICQLIFLGKKVDKHTLHLVQSLYLVNILGVQYHIKRVVSVMLTRGEFLILKRTLLLWFGIYVNTFSHKRDWIRYWLMTTCFSIYTLHIFYSVVRLFVYSVVCLFGCSVMRVKCFVYSCSLIGYSCSFVRLFVSAVQLGVVLTVGPNPLSFAYNKI